MSKRPKTEDELRAEFLLICEESFRATVEAFPDLSSESFASDESLSMVAKSCYDSFFEAAAEYKKSGQQPLVSGTDPHHHESKATALSAALSNVFGFTVCKSLEVVNPKSVAALRALQPIANLIHVRGYCIFT
jgi:hypothetical protein